MNSLYYPEKYLNLNSFIHKINPTVKIVVILFYIITVVTSPADILLPFLYPGLVLLIMIFLSRIPFLYFIKRSLIIIPFSVMIGICMPFYIEGKSLAEIPLPFFTLTLTYEGLREFIVVVIKSWYSVLSMIILNSTTPFPDLIKGFNNLCIPKILVINIAFMYRYLSVLIQEGVTMLRARDCRYFGGFNTRHIKTAGYMAGILFIRTVERSERIYNSMISRGFEGEIKTLSEGKPGWKDIFFAIFFIVILLILKFAVKF